MNEKTHYQLINYRVINKMKVKLIKLLFSIVAIIQLILHYLGWFNIVFGVIALIFNNINRGADLIMSGVGFIFIKYLIGFIFFTVICSIMNKIFRKILVKKGMKSLNLKA